ncbi:Na+/H+ antiporter NhaA [soil metagenome]
MFITKLFREFLESEKSGGIFLIVCTFFSLLITNSTAGTSYINLWHSELFGSNIEHWINDGLMTFFFLLIGLELKREVHGIEKLKELTFPVFGAIGGIVVPAGIYILLNFGTETLKGAGIPMATDIAFALGILSLLGSRVPVSLKLFLTALAVIDDLCAILIIAIFYSKAILIYNLLISIGVFGVLLLFNKLKIRFLIIYIAGGVVMWYFMHLSGVHATIAGVLLAFTIPFNVDKEKCSSDKLQHILHKPVAYFVLPLFALANTAIIISSDFGNAAFKSYSIGIALGLILGKPIGIFLMSYLGSLLGFYKLPQELNWKMIFGVGLMCGIGFTMSIFITLLAFENTEIINNSKIIILISSFTSGILGYFYLKYNIKESPKG